jgi:hypothetical protein
MVQFSRFLSSENQKQSGTPAGMHYVDGGDVHLVLL